MENRELRNMENNELIPMDNRDYLNILVLGNSGAGKSTLIKAISGKEIPTGVGEGNTQKISVYESDTWPFRLIDTKGFEFNILAQMDTIRQVKKYTKAQVKNADFNNRNQGIDVVWYCVEGTSRRAFTANIEMMNQSIRGWKNIPVFAVITKSYSQKDIESNQKAIALAFARGKKVNLQDVIPVVAAPYEINDELVVPVSGIERLCRETLECTELAKDIKKENLDRMVLEQRRFTANTYVAGATVAAAAIGIAPINTIHDAALLVPLETGLTTRILKTYNVNSTNDLIAGIVGSAAVTNVAKFAVGQLKTIPNIAGNVANAIVAGVVVAALGESVIAVSEAIYKGTIDPAKTEEVINYVQQKISKSPQLQKIFTYIESHPEVLKHFKADDIFKIIVKAVSQKSEMPDNKSKSE